MRKNRTKHEAKKPRLAKRALALCFALIFVCSCLLPAFANSGENQLTDLAQETVVKQQDEQPTEPVPLTEGGTDSTEGNEEQDEQKQEEANASKETSKESSSSSSGEASGESQSTAPSESASSEGSASTAPGESASSSSASSEASGEPEQPASSEPKTEQPASSEQPANSETKTEETKPEEPKQPTTNTTGDTIEQGKATYTYRFWPDKIDAFELEAINDDVKSGTSLNDAAQSRAGMVPCTVLTVMTNANLRDYQANVQQPTKSGYEFAGWYTVDGTAEDEFSFEQNLNFEKSQTIDVFAKWNELVTLQTTVTVDVDATLFGGEAAISLADEYSYEDDRMAAPTKTLTLDVEATNLSSNSELSVSSTSSSAIEKYCDNNELMPILTLDITPKDKVSDKKTEPQGTSTVTISGLSELELPDELTMVHKKDDGEIEKIPAQYSNGTLTFKATSFSTYAVAAAATMDSPLETRYMEGRTIYNDNKRVFLYVKVEGDTSDLVLNTDGWYTLGYVDLDNSLTMHNRDYVGYWEKTGGAAANAYSTSGDNWDKVITALGGSNQSVLGWGTNSKVTRYTKNNSIALKDVKWNQAGYGLVATKGATDYDGYVNGTYYGVNGNQYIAWHLDGYLRADEFTSYTVNYYAMVNGQPIFVKKVSRDVPVDTVIYAKDFEDETLSYDDGTYYNNGTYKFDHHDKEQITAVKKGENVINLYYRDTSKKYPLFLFAKMSKTVMEKLNKANSDLNSDEWFTLGYIEDSGLSEPESKAPNPKYKEENQKYNTAVGKLSTETVHRYPQNSNVNLDDITWNYEDIDGVQFGLTTAGGANDYADPNNSTEINGETITENTRTWHLDGYIANLGAIVVNYYIEGTEDRLQPSVTHLGSPNRSYTLTDDEKPDSLEKGSVTYKLKNIVPSETQQFPENDVAIINLYYERVVDPSNIPDSGESFIVVEKRFSGLTENTIPKDFTITVGGTSYGLSSASPMGQDDNDYVVRWKITGVDAGTYTIKESEYDKPGYKTEAKVTGSTATFDPVAGTTVTVEVPTLNSFSATVITPKDNPSYDVKMEGTTNTIFVGRLTGKVGKGLIVFTKEPLSYAQREAIKNKLGTYSMGPGNIWGGTDTEVHFYSVDEQLQNGNFNIDGSYVTYNNDKITFSDQGIWNMVATATYSTTEAQNPEVSITNTYTLNTTNVTITKKTTGAFADRAKAFKFTVSGLNADATLDDTATGNSVNFELANGNSKTIKNLTVGTIFTITEDATDSKDYDTTDTCHTEKAKSFKYKVCFDETSGKIYLQALDANGNAITGKTITGENLSITVTNNFDGNPDTGVLLDTLPYLILLAVAVAGGVLVVVRKRKHRDE